MQTENPRRRLKRNDTQVQHDPLHPNCHEEAGLVTNNCKSHTAALKSEGEGTIVESAKRGIDEQDRNMSSKGSYLMTNHKFSAFNHGAASRGPFMGNGTALSGSFYSNLVEKAVGGGRAPPQRSTYETFGESRQA